MIKQVEEKQELQICLNIIHKSFETVAKEFHLTTENCPGHTSFMPIERLENQLSEKRSMFLYVKDNEYVGYFSLNQNNETSFELNNLAVLPDYRHLGIGEEMVQFAKQFVSETYGGNQLTIGIIEDSIILREWYQRLGFVHTGTRRFEHLPFTVGYMELNWSTVESLYTY